MRVILKRYFTDSNNHLMLGTMNYNNSLSPIGLSILALTLLHFFFGKIISHFLCQSMQMIDLIIISSNLITVQRVVTQLASKFSIKYLGVLFYFLGIKVLPTLIDILLSQHKYIQDLLSIAKMDNTNDMSTPISPSNVLVLLDNTSLIVHC